MKTIADLNLKGKRVLVRQDLNVPIRNGVVASSARIDAALPTITALLKSGASVAIMSHLGRPEESTFESGLSLEPVAKVLSKKLNFNVPLIDDWIDGFSQQSDLVLLENVRFLKGELSDDEGLAKKMAALCDVFVMDAFGTAHRAQASTNGVCRFAKEAVAGPLMAAELSALGKAFENPKRPSIAIIGGSKVSTKLNVLIELTKQVDQIIVGGGIANTFLAAAGFNVGKSLMEPTLVDSAKSLMSEVDIPLPTDVVVSKQLSAEAVATVKVISDVAEDDMILDVGPKTQSTYSSMMANAKTILWNGPVGVFELPQFQDGTRALSQAIAKSRGFSLAGGGDTIAAIDQFQIADSISYISTGGGAFLEFIEGKELPAVATLKARSADLIIGNLSTPNLL